MSDSLFDLTGKVALVTGASRGLGQYMARALARAGADLVVTSRRVDEALAETCREIEAIGRKAVPVALDVRDEESVARFVAEAVAAFGRVDVLLNNAGCNVRRPAVETSWEDWSQVVDTNLRGPFFVAQGIARASMIPRRSGRIVNIGSVTSAFGFAGIAPYCASRGGVKQMTASLAAEWGRHGITVNCLAPGFFKTKQTAALYEDAGWVEYMTERVPLGRPGEPGDLDGAIVFLSSDASRYVTGQTLFVDGGITTGSMRVTPGK